MDFWDIARPVISALVGTGAFGALYKFHVVDRIGGLEREKLALKVEAEQRENRCIAEKHELEQRCRRLEEQQRQDVESIGRAYMHPRRPDEPPPTAEQLLQVVRPEGDWDDKTLRTQVLDAYLQEQLQQWKDTTPPKAEGRRAAVDAVIIDDNTPMLRALETVVQRALPPKWIVSAVPDPHLGRSIAIADPRVKLVLVDYLMPNINGEELVRDLLKARPNLRGRVIIVSGVDYPKDLEHRLFKELGCLRWDKGDDLDSLTRLVHKALGKTPPPFKVPRQ